MKALIRPFICIVSALMALSFASCNDFLDKEPEGKVPEEKVDYTNISNISACIGCIWQNTDQWFALGDLGNHHHP